MEKDTPVEQMKVELSLSDGQTVMCEVLTILEVNGKDYIALIPEGYEQDDEQEVWFYAYSENLDDPDEEPELTYIDDDEIYEAVCDAFEEYLDDCEFDEE